MAQSYDISVKQGSTFSMMLTIKDPTEVPIDLTGYIFRGQIRKTYSDPVVQAVFEFEIQDQITDQGKVLCTLTAQQSAGISVDETESYTRKITKMIYDIESEIGDEVTRWLEGTANISPEVTR